MSKHILIIGGGAAGLMAAKYALDAGARVTLVEKNEKLGKKLYITGKGRCNVTNACTLVSELMENIPGSGRFLFSAFSRFMPSDVIELFESLGVPLKIERGNRVFPVSDNAHDIADALAKYARDCGAEIVTDTAVKGLVLRDGAVCGVKTADGKTREAAAVIVATGGISSPASFSG